MMLKLREKKHPFHLTIEFLRNSRNEWMNLGLWEYMLNFYK